MLLGVLYCPDFESFRRRNPSLVHADTRFRGEEGHYELNFKEAIVLTLHHLNAGKLFTTIRRYAPAKYAYYKSYDNEASEPICRTINIIEILSSVYAVRNAFRRKQPLRYMPWK